MVIQRTQAMAKTVRYRQGTSWIKPLASAVMLSAAALLSSTLMARSESAPAEEPLIKSHGYNFFGAFHYPPDYPHLDYVNPDAPKGGEMAIWAPGTFDSFNLYTRKGRAGALATIGHESILTSFADDATALYCLLCETMEYPASIDYVIFNLRPEVRFTDGTPMTAEDLKFTFDLFMEQGLPSFRAAFGAMIDGVEVLGPHRIKFSFTETSPIRDRIGLAGTFAAFSKSWFEEGEHRLDEGSLTPIMGTGPYELDSYDINRRIVYKRRPDYWGKDLPQNIGRHNFDTIRVEYFADSNAAFEGFKAGAYTFRDENSSKTWATGYDFSRIQDGSIKKVQLPKGTLAPGQSYVFNLRRDKFQDIRVREAIGMMFNFEWSNQSLFYGLYARVHSFWGNSDLEAKGAPTPEEAALLRPLVDEGILSEEILTQDAVLPPVSSERQLDRKLLRRASALLDEAGWIVGDDGLRRKDGEVLTVELLYSAPAFDRINTPFAKNMERLGIQAIANRVDPAQETAREREYDFDMITHSFSMSWEPSTGLKQWFHSDAMEGSSRNLMGLADPAVDRMVETVIAAASKQDMVTAVHALDRVLRAKLFWVPQFFSDKHNVAYYDQYGHPETLAPFDPGYLDYWWFIADKHQALVDAGALR